MFSLSLKEEGLFPKFGMTYVLPLPQGRGLG